MVREIVDHYPKMIHYCHDTFFVKTEEETRMPDLSGISKREALMFSEFMDIPVSVDGEGYVQQQSVEAGTAIVKRRRSNLHFHPMTRTIRRIL